jgi:hypothetical protein
LIHNKRALEKKSKKRFEFSDNIFLINTEGCKITKLDPYVPLIKAHLNNGTELKCVVQEDLVYRFITNVHWKRNQRKGLINIIQNKF